MRHRALAVSDEAIERRERHEEGRLTYLAPCCLLVDPDRAPLSEREAMQARIDELYASGDRMAASALLSTFLQRFLPEAQNEGGSGLSREERERVERARDSSPARRSPHRLIEEESVSRAETAIARPQPNSPARRVDLHLPTNEVRLEGLTAEESEQVKALMTSGKGRLVLSNGNVVENDRMIVFDAGIEISNTLTPLSPVLAVWLKTFKAYIPLTVFNKIWLTLDQQAWGVREHPSEAKVTKGGAALRAYGGAAPPEELELQFEDWLDCMILFRKYVKAAGWLTLELMFEGHQQVVMDLREAFGWMCALRYCCRIRQGVMRETIDNKIGNFSTLQKSILDDIKEICEARTERASLRTNPYAPGGARQHIHPGTGFPKSSKGGQKRPAPDELEVAETEEKKKWLPYVEYKEKKREERLAKNKRRRDDDRRDDRRDYDRDSRFARDRSEDRGRRWQDDRGRDRRRSRSRSRGRERRRSRSRSRSPARRGGRGGRGGRGRQ